MTSASVIKSVKYRANIPLDNDVFDPELEDFANDAVARLYPIVVRELAEDTTTTLSADTHTFSLPTGTDAIRSGGLFIKNSTDTDDCYQSYDEFTLHGSTVYLQEDFDTAKTIKILGLGRHTINTLPEEFKVAIVYYVLSDFFSLLAGNKAKYNQYLQATGARSVDNMREMSDWYSEKAAQEVADRAQIQGV